MEIKVGQRWRHKNPNRTHLNYATIIERRENGMYTLKWMSYTRACFTAGGWSESSILNELVLDETSVVELILDKYEDSELPETTGV